MQKTPGHGLPLRSTISTGLLAKFMSLFVGLSLGGAVLAAAPAAPAVQQVELKTSMG